MNEKVYKRLLYVIIVTLILTVVVQVYWNYNNYLQNKQHFIAQVQTSLDNALEDYYSNLAESNEMAFIDIKTDTLNGLDHFKDINPDSIFLSLQSEFKDKTLTGYSQILNSGDGFTYHSESNHTNQMKVIKGKKATDSIKLLQGITSIYISIQDDSLNFSKLNPLIHKELNRKSINIPYALTHYRNDSVFNSFNKNIINSDFLKSTSKTKFLKSNETLELAYPNAKKVIFSRGLSGILLSIILTLTIISSLLYLLRIIKHQKQLAEVKNDLISNITHEFKTPIATIGVALESIKSFNVIDNKEKTKSYVGISEEQLDKLNLMVEKLLETATLDSDDLSLSFEDVNIIDLLKNIVTKYSLQTGNKTINLESNLDTITSNIDIFHFENAISNIIDNAIKYGGDVIKITVTNKIKTLAIDISDNGNLDVNYKDKIFEKFYRIPKGNTHDVKGFGIGLYYTKKIIEKHKGHILLDLSNELTTFKISLPHDN